MKIAEILEKYGIQPRHGEIHLGTVNGWGAERNELYTALNEYHVADSGTERELGRCYTEYSFTINDGTDEYILVYSVDSGD